MRVAALYDVHGNLPALEAVLRELAYERVDRIVFGGDLAAGPIPRETLELAGNLPNAEFVRGNCDRYIVEVIDGRREPAPSGVMNAWVVDQLGHEHRDFLATFEPTVSLDGVLYCHTTPSADEPVFTRVTPDERVRELLGEVQEHTVVVGHTHMQFDRRIGETRVVNAGSVGLPYGTLDACWALVVDGEPELRRTPFDRQPLLFSAYPEDSLQWFLVEHDEEDRIAFFEAQAATG